MTNFYLEWAFLNDVFDWLEVNSGHQILTEGRRESIVYYDVIKKILPGSNLGAIISYISE